MGRLPGAPAIGAAADLQLAGHAIPARRAHRPGGLACRCHASDELARQTGARPGRATVVSDVRAAGSVHEAIVVIDEPHRPRAASVRAIEGGPNLHRRRPGRAPIQGAGDRVLTASAGDRGAVGEEEPAGREIGDVKVNQREQRAARGRGWDRVWSRRGGQRGDRGPVRGGRRSGRERHGDRVQRPHHAGVRNAADRQRREDRDRDVGGEP